VSQLIQLKQKIRIIQTTKKISHAIRLVSMSLYAKLEKKNLAIDYHTRSICELLSKLLILNPDWKNSILFPGDILDRDPLFIVISTTKGLCGSINSNLFRYFSKSTFFEGQQFPKFITIGQKATNFITKNCFGEIICTYKELNSNNFSSITDNLVSKIIDGDIKFSSISFYSNCLKTFFIQKPRKTSLIPINNETIKLGKNNENTKNIHQEHVNFDDDLLVWEQDKQRILDYLSINYIQAIIAKLLFDALLAEYAARFIAMDNSTNNAEKFLKKLTLDYNKQRQASITAEVAELSSSLPDL
jgi:F-type H+-transporting ATPase subunit gamma